ncbi:CotS family spore coat protein [Paenibacillus soyae]|uniref:CotS family spore coat protein n=1 Tax=Paenibacillus soyae TaxID=2969249 RepID=A0A9X2S9G5_9BACL|nr:CotS family spore coat protein [Paenibacillus soyae]MCR2805115.1 CotS family spore coat protein [Paenibacillus soyae]
MEQYRIVPWDDMLTEETSGINLEQYVPPELEQLAYQVCKSYAMDVKGMTLITSKPDKGGAIWRIETNHGPRSLKVLHRTPERSLFSVGAQEYVVGKGGRVPAIIHTKDGNNSVVAGGKLWIVTDWIDTLTPVAKIDLDGAMTLCHGLGEFHSWTKGYVPPLEAGRSSRIFKWESQYEKIMTKIGWFRHIGLAYPEAAASPHLLSVLDTFEQQAKDIFARFQASSYRKMIRKGESHWGLAHQDYGWSNGQMGPNGIWVIDLDGVAYDLPIRDLRKIITSTMDDMGAWDLAWIRGVIDAYHRANPLDRETFELLWIDMAFPNEFYKHVKEVVFRPVEFMNTELDAILDRVVATEANKWEVLRELEKDMANYPSGNYPDVEEEAASEPYAYRDYARGSRPVEGGAPAESLRPVQEERRRSSKIIRLVVQPDGSVRLVEGPRPATEPRRVVRTAPGAESQPLVGNPARRVRKKVQRRRSGEPRRAAGTAQSTKPRRLQSGKQASRPTGASKPKQAQPRAARPQPKRQAAGTTTGRLKKSTAKPAVKKKQSAQVVKTVVRSPLQKPVKKKAVGKAVNRNSVKSYARKPSAKAFITAFRRSATMREIAR